MPNNFTQEILKTSALTQTLAQTKKIDPMTCWTTPQTHSLLHYQHPLSKEDSPFLPIDESAGLCLHLPNLPFTFEFIPGVIYTVDRSP